RGGAQHCGHDAEGDPRGQIVLDHGPDRYRTEHQEDAGDQRNHDADQSDGDSQRHEDDPAGAHGRFPRTHWMVAKLFVRTPTRPRSSSMSPISSSPQKCAPPSGSSRIKAPAAPAVGTITAI